MLKRLPKVQGQQIIEIVHERNLIVINKKIWLIKLGNDPRNMQSDSQSIYRGL
jgi:hypothetical protein